MCRHIKYEKGNTFIDHNGARRRIAELCGHHTADGGGVRFIEGSWVRTPAFTGAALRNIISPQQLTTGSVKRAADVLAEVPHQWTLDEVMMGRRASTLVLSGDDDYGFGDQDQGDAAEQPAAPEAPKKEKDPDKLTKVRDDIYDEVLNKVRDKADKDLKGPTPNNPAEAPNDSIVKQARAAEAAALNYRAGLEALVKTAHTAPVLMTGVAAFNRSCGVKLPPVLYDASLHAVQAGSLRTGSWKGYLLACQRYLGREPNQGEGRTLIRLGKLLQVWESGQQGKEVGAPDNRTNRGNK